MQLHVIKVEDIIVPKNRQRKFFDEASILELAASIAEVGLIHPLVVRHDKDGELLLVAGERRLKALDVAWGYGQKVLCNNHEIPEQCVPCVFLGELDELTAFEVELEENIRRTDLDWKEKAVAVARLYDLRKQQSEANSTQAPTAGTIAEEISGSGDGQFAENVRQDIILARNLDNPVVNKAASRKEAFKALKRDEEVKRNAELGERIGATFSSDMHTLLQGDCTSILPTLPEASFDVILTDPPYGMGADSFGDSAGKTAGAHRYEDTGGEAWFKLMLSVAFETWRVTKPAAHLYMFCDIDKFHDLRDMYEEVGWKCFRTPLIWINPTAMRAPWPEQGPQRKWQAILYAVKGNRNVTRLYGDVLTYASDDNLGHQAQKPVGLYKDLLQRSIKPGDMVLDPFCGSGPIFPACHGLKCKATGIEMEAAAAGIASTRIKELK